MPSGKFAFDQSPNSDSNPNPNPNPNSNRNPIPNLAGLPAVYSLTPQLG